MTDHTHNVEATAQLVERSRRGDEEAFGELMRTHYQRTYALAYNMVGNAEDARDLAQQAWVKVWTHLAGFKGDAQFATWLYRIVTSTCTDFLRKRVRRAEVQVEDAEMLDAAASSSADADVRRAVRPDETAARGEVRVRFEQALALLTPEHRTALVLREVDGLSYEEMARVMNCRIGTVMSRLHNARRKIQEHMGGLGGGDK